MSTAGSAVSPFRSVDARGRALPMTDEEVRARADEIDLDGMGEEESQRQALEALELRLSLSATTRAAGTWSSRAFLVPRSTLEKRPPLVENTEY